jgi:hypothetical protein
MSESREWPNKTNRYTFGQWIECARIRLNNDPVGQIKDTGLQLDGRLAVISYLKDRGINEPLAVKTWNRYRDWKSNRKLYSHLERSP